MGNWNLGSVADRVQARIENIPTAISGTNIQNFAEEVIYDLNNQLNISINNASIDDKYKNLVVNLTCAYTLSYMIGQGAKFDVSLGEFSISKSSPQTPNDRQLNFFITQANSSISALKNRMKYSKVVGI